MNAPRTELSLDGRRIAEMVDDFGSGGAATVAELVEDFLADAPHRVHQMSVAGSRGAPEVLARAAHALRSPSGVFGANRLAALAAEMESAAQAGENARSCALVEEIRHELARVEVELRMEVRRLQGEIG